MQDRTRLGFASCLRADRGSLVLAAVLSGCMSMLGGCASDPKYPSLGTITDLGTVLTPEQRQKTVDQLNKDDQTHTSDAAKAIASR